AYEAICKLFPNKQKDYDLYKTEPYAYAEYLVGPQHPYLYGEGAFTWVTGSSGWTFMTVTELFLGVRRDFDGLRIDPRIPSYWKNCSIKRKFRGAAYDIKIDNNAGVESGIDEIYVDGELISGNVIEPHSDGKTHKVRVVMGG
ncbi:MAG TPA: glycosyl transferase family 36, partial [Candidatus Omnitrophica bacterium]|nr:glycosyl transferase family 36 [Candidatus Omnitrophota bacterium]